MTHHDSTTMRRADAYMIGGKGREFEYTRYECPTCGRNRELSTATVAGRELRCNGKSITFKDATVYAGKSFDQLASVQASKQAHQQLDLFKESETKRRAAYKRRKSIIANKITQH